MYQIVGQHHLPWDRVIPDETTPEAILLNVAYDRTELAVDETVEVAVTAMLNPALVPTDTTSWAAESAIIEMGIPPGFEVRREDLGQIVSRFENHAGRSRRRAHRAVRSDRGPDHPLRDQPHLARSALLHLPPARQIPRRRPDAGQPRLRPPQPRRDGQSPAADANGDPRNKRVTITKQQDVKTTNKQPV